MTISSTTTRNQYTGNNSTTVFAYGFKIFADADLLVVLTDTSGVETVKTLTTHYTVSGAGTDSGGNVTFTSGNTPGTGVIVTILRNTAITQSTDYVENDTFPAASHETALDRLTAIDQHQQDRIERSLKAPDSEASGYSMTLPAKASRLGTVLGFNATSGNPEAGPKIADVSSLAAITADIATLADIEDGTNATNAIQTVAGQASNIASLGPVSGNIATLGTSDAVSDMNTLAAISSNISTVAGISSSVSSVAGVSSLLSSDFISDLNTLATSDIVTDLNLLATSQVVADMAALAGSGGAPNVSTVNISNITLTDNSSTALQIKEGSNNYLTFDTTDSSEQVSVGTTSNQLTFVVNGSFNQPGPFSNTTFTSKVFSSSQLISTNGSVTIESHASDKANILLNGSGDQIIFTAPNLGFVGNIELVGGFDATGVAAAATFEPDGDTAAGDNAAIGYTAAEGLILTGQGSTNDVTIKNDADADVIEIPTGTTNVTIAGNLGVGGTVTGTGTSVFASLDISGDIDVDGTTNLDAVDIDGAVDMASTLAVGGVVTANAGVVVDNITIDGTEIDLSSGNLTLDVAGNINLNADGGQIVLFDGSTQYGNFLMNNSGDVSLHIETQDKSFKITGNDGGVAVTAVTLDMSAAGAAKFNSTLSVGDAGQGFYQSNAVNIYGASVNPPSTVAGNLLVNSTDAMAADKGGSITLGGQYTSSGVAYHFGAIQAVKLNSTSGDAAGTFKAYVTNSANGSDAFLQATQTEVVFNESSRDVDFRVESNNSANMFFVDGGNDKVGIGTGSPTAHGLTVDSTASGAFPIQLHAGGSSTAPSAGTFSTLSNNNHGDLFIASNAYVNTNHNPVIANTHSSMGATGIMIGGNTNETLRFFVQQASVTEGTEVTTAEKMRLSSSGNLGVGTSSINEKLVSAGTVRALGATVSNEPSTTMSYSSGVGGIEVRGPDTSTRGSLNLYQSASNGSLGQTALHITSAGDVQINNGDLTITSTDAASTTAGPVLTLARDGASPQDNDLMGQIVFKMDDDAGNLSTFAKIDVVATDVSNGSEDARIDFTAAKDDVFSVGLSIAGQNVGIGTSSPSGSLHLLTPAGSSGSENTKIPLIVQENSFSSANLIQLRDSAGGSLSAFDQSGNLGIGTSSPLRSLHVAGSGDTGIMLQTTAATDDSEIWEIQVAEDASSLANLIFRTRANNGTGGSEAMRIDRSGNLLCGRSSVGSTGDGHSIRGGDSAIFSRDASGETVQVCRNSSSGDLVRFLSNGVDKGSINFDGSNTISYTTSSDHRLKENVVYDWDATTRLKKLKPARFNFIADDTTVDGFLAHEVQSIVPEAITGTKDEVDDNGNPVYQGIDQSKLVGLLVKTIQELEARITALEGA